MFRTLFSRAPDPAEIDLETFTNALRRGDAAVVDVREPHEFVAGHIPDAVNLPLSRFEPTSLAERQAGGSHLPVRRSVSQRSRPGARRRP